MTFNKFYTTSSAGYIKLKHACVRHRLSIQQGDCMAQLTLNSLAQTQFELLFYLTVWFLHCSREMDYQELSEAQSTPEIWGTFYQHFLCRSIADRSIVSLEKTTSQSFRLPSLPKASEVTPHWDRPSGWCLVLPWAHAHSKLHHCWG